MTHLETISLIGSLLVFIIGGILFMMAHLSYSKRTEKSSWFVRSWDMLFYKGKERKLLIAAILLFLISIIIYVSGNPAQTQVP